MRRLPPTLPYPTWTQSRHNDHVTLRALPRADRSSLTSRSLRLRENEVPYRPNPSQDREMPSCPLPNQLEYGCLELARFLGRKKSPARNFMTRAAGVAP